MALLRVTTDHAEIGHDLSLARRGHAGTSFLDDPRQLIARSERQRSLEVRVTDEAAAHRFKVSKIALTQPIERA
jgi:hypothetical protein